MDHDSVQSYTRRHPNWLWLLLYYYLLASRVAGTPF
jgi:hypothetical protein